MFLEIKKFIIKKNIDKYLWKKIQWFDITAFISNLNLFGNTAEESLARITMSDSTKKVKRMYKNKDETSIGTVGYKPIDVVVKDLKPLNKEEAKEVLQKARAVLNSKK